MRGGVAGGGFGIGLTIAEASVDFGALLQGDAPGAAVATPEPIP